MNNHNRNELLDQKSEGPFVTWSDESIIEKVIGGDVDLFSVLVQRYNQRLFRIIRGYLNNEQDTKDVMQTTYLKAFEHLDQFRAASRFSTWLIRIAINEALKKLKSESKFSDSHSVTNGGKNNLTNASESSTPETALIQKDMTKHLEKAIDSLPPKYRSVLIMREIEQLTTEETSRILNISEANVKVRLYRAKEKLREELLKMLGDFNLYSFKGNQCEKMTEQVMKLIKQRA